MNNNKNPKQNTTTQTNTKKPTTKPPKSPTDDNVKSSWADILKRYNAILGQYAGLPDGKILTAISQAAQGAMQNMPMTLNQRIKAISSLPEDYSKEEIGSFLRNPYASEIPLRRTSEILKWTAYPYYKIIKTYADIATCHYYVKPAYLDENEIGSKDFLREATLIDKFCKEFRPDVLAHEAIGKALSLGKVFYYYRYDIDKSHNTVRNAFWQQIPSDWIYIVGRNNISGWTISFNLMYFMQPGTNWRSFGDLFEPYLDDFNEMFAEPEAKTGGRVLYSAHTVNCKGKRINFYPENLKKNAFGNPTLKHENGTWFYYVTLPVERIFGFEIDDTTANVSSPLSGLMLTYAQQSDYEAAQLSLLLNPLIKIFTGEIPYFKETSNNEDAWRLSAPAREMYQVYFDDLMAANNTGGTAFFTAPVERIQSHDFKESANSNEVSESFNRYGMEKAGLAAVLPATDDVKAGQVEASVKIESRYATATIYPQIERMMNIIIESMNLFYTWEFKMFGTIFTDDKIRDNAYKAIANGDISQHFILSALDGTSLIDKITMMNAINKSGMLDLLIPPVTSYTMKQSANGGLPPQSKNGRPQTEGISSEAKEKAIDAGISGI